MLRREDGRSRGVQPVFWSTERPLELIQSFRKCCFAGRRPVWSDRRDPLDFGNRTLAVDPIFANLVIDGE